MTDETTIPAEEWPGGPAARSGELTRDGTLGEAVRTLVDVLRRRDLLAVAAPVAGLDRRLLVLRPPAGEGAPWVFLDPWVESVAREREAEIESCLCLPGFQVRVPRPRELVVRARLPGGRSVRFAAGGELARALLHQLDHLEDVLPTERVDEDVRREMPDSVVSPPSHCPRCEDRSDVRS